MGAVIEMSVVPSVAAEAAAVTARGAAAAAEAAAATCAAAVKRVLAALAEREAVQEADAGHDVAHLHIAV